MKCAYLPLQINSNVQLYFIQVLFCENKYGNFGISGDFHVAEEEFGKIFTVTIEEDYNSKYPNSYKLIKLHYEFPDNPREQWEFLESGNIVPLNVFIKIKKAFKSTEKILDIMVDEPSRLEEIKGIGLLIAFLQSIS